MEEVLGDKPSVEAADLDNLTYMNQVELKLPLLTKAGINDLFTLGL